MSVGSAECLMADVEGRGYTRTLGGIEYGYNCYCF